MDRAPDCSQHPLPRLLMVSGSFPDIPCGVSPHIERISRLIAQRGLYDVHVLTSDDPLVKPQVARGYQVHSDIRTWKPTRARSICRRIIALRPDIVHLQNLTRKYRGLCSVTMSVVAPLLKKMIPDVPLVVTQHDVAVSVPLLRWRYYPLFCSADAILVSNRRDEQAVCAQGIAAAKIYRASLSTYVKLHPPDPQIRTVARQKLGIPPSSICATYFGYIHPSRNIDILLRALHLLRQQGRNLYGLIIGGPHPEPKARKYHQRCRRLAQNLGLSDHLTWTGFADDQQVADGLAASDIFVSLIQRGADLRNSTIITAILAHLPVITCRNPRYYVDPDLDELGCLTVGPRDLRTLADAIDKLSRTPTDPALLTRRAALLDPAAVWERHIDVILQAYRGEPPPVAPSFRP